MAQGENYSSYNGILEWLNPATKNARLIASDSSKFACELRSTERSAKKELLSLSDCSPYSVDFSGKRFLDSMDGAKSSGDKLKSKCDALCKEWKKFANDYAKSSKGKKESTELDKLLKDMNKLLKKCAACRQQYSVTQEKLKTAINDCSLFVKELEKEADRKRKEKSARKLKGYGAAVVGLGAAVLGRLSDKFSKDRGSMKTMRRCLMQLSDLIASLERSTKDMTRSIENGRRERVKDTTRSKEQENKKLKDTIRSQEQENEKLKEQLRKAGISDD
ncbi:hypothetical protein BOX15_Mlig004740g1 [Macrostomum lignano]|uniref:Uncharacterized protein n=1 Tax=Macrostomum lignano TaxID=282301 RepID=A0A267G4Q1_9PLAT|nr:hypothetical protein BOX15_Mlig004740g1 [Macrostomum lignano]